MYTCVQINAPTVIESYNIILYGDVGQTDVAKSALMKCTENQSVLFCCDSETAENGNSFFIYPKYVISCFYAVKGFTSNVTCAVVGHWSKDNFSGHHFNFSSHSNALVYKSKKPTSSCTHHIMSINELLRQLLLLLSFPGQTIIELFPKFSCGK